MLNWEKLLCEGRYSDSKKKTNSQKKHAWLIDGRREIERDYDRILFSTPVRRLGDKTQVFPLEKIESVRTRLTHSHEVSNLSRSIGTYLASEFLVDKISGSRGSAEILRDIPAMLAATGLAHDLGNPPFGHQGENAIRSWVEKNRERLFPSECAQNECLYNECLYEDVSKLKDDISSLTKAHINDFIKFEGNAQMLRVVTRLQVVENDLGLNLTYGTLGALMKYSVGSDNLAENDDAPATKKKVGFFVSEKKIAEKIWEETGLAEGIRHPLTYIMEACDDIAYTILDAEDSVKKQLVSFSDLLAWLESQKETKEDKLTKWVIRRAKKDHSIHRKKGLSPSELNDISMQKFRVYGIHAMVSAITKAFTKKYNDIMKETFTKPLISVSLAHNFQKVLKKFDFEHGYRHRSVLAVELRGYNVLHELMDMLWRGIIERKKFTELDSKRTSPFAAYAYGRISENYRRVFEGKLGDKVRDDDSQPIRYKELQLLTDMISGMTDNFALDLHQELKSFHVGPSGR